MSTCMSTCSFLKWGEKMPCFFVIFYHTPRSDFVNSEVAELIFRPQILEPRCAGPHAEKDQSKTEEREIFQNFIAFDFPWQKLRVVLVWDFCVDLFRACVGLLSHVPCFLHPLPLSSETQQHV